MSLRKFSSGLKKKLKRRLAGDRHEPGGPGADASGERVDSTGSLPQPESHAIARGEHDHPQSGNEDDADRGRVDSTNPTPRSDDSGFVPASESQHDGGVRRVAIEGGGASEWDLHPGLSVMGVGSPSQGGSDVDRVDPPLSVPLISSLGGQSEST